MSTEKELYDKMFKHAKNMGGALKGIRDQKLYREIHETFEDYVKDKWGEDIEWANRMIAAHENPLI